MIESIIGKSAGSLIPVYNSGSNDIDVTEHLNLSLTGFVDKVAWEAMACGRPCLGGNEGLRETLGQYADELLYEYANANSLADQLEWLVGL